MRKKAEYITIKKVDLFNTFFFTTFTILIIFQLISTLLSLYSFYSYHFDMAVETNNSFYTLQAVGVVFIMAVIILGDVFMVLALHVHFSPYIKKYRVKAEVIE